MDSLVRAASPGFFTGHQRAWERLVRLPHLGVMIERPEFPLPSDRSAFGLPIDANLYGCPQTLFKMHPDFDPLLGAILHAEPRGRLVMLEGQHPAWTGRLKRRLARTLPDVADRVTWLPRLPRDRFRQLVSTCDVLLDPPHFGGGHTSYEAFASGVPVVTRPSENLRGRLTFAMLQQMGLTELSATNASDYGQPWYRSRPTTHDEAEDSAILRRIVRRPQGAAGILLAVEVAGRTITTTTKGSEYFRPNIRADRSRDFATGRPSTMS